MPDLIHIKNESHLGMDGTRDDGHGTYGPSGGPGAALYLDGFLLRSIQS